MQLFSFDYDADGASVVSHAKRNSNEGTVNKVVLSNGVEFVYIETTSGDFKKLDTNFVLVKQLNGFYKSDLNEPKRDYRDYF